jgi:hypothetical protein
MRLARTTVPSCTLGLIWVMTCSNPIRPLSIVGCGPDVRKNQDTSVSKAKKAITDYKKAIGKPEELAELMVFYCEHAVGFCNAVGLDDDGYYYAIVTMFEQALKLSATLPLEVRRIFFARLDAVRDASRNFGYGVADQMDASFAQYDREW